MQRAPRKYAVATATVMPYSAVADRQLAATAPRHAVNDAPRPLCGRQQGRNHRPLTAHAATHPTICTTTGPHSTIQAMLGPSRATSRTFEGPRAQIRCMDRPVRAEGSMDADTRTIRARANQSLPDREGTQASPCSRHNANDTPSDLQSSTYAPPMHVRNLHSWSLQLYLNAEREVRRHQLWPRIRSII